MRKFFASLVMLLIMLNAQAQDIRDAQWISSSSILTPSATHYSINWDFAIQKGNAGFLFSGNAKHNTYYMWQVNLESGKERLKPFICINGAFKLLDDIDISNKVNIRQDKGRMHHLRLDINQNVVTTNIDGVMVSTYQVPYPEVSYGEIGIREMGNETVYLDNLLVQDLSNPTAPHTLIAENFDGTNSMDSGLVIRQRQGNQRLDITGTTSWYASQQKGIPVFRKKFVLNSAIKHATLQCSALGIYNVFINGRRIGTDELKPGWTDYRKEVPYQETDVTASLRKGDNCIATEVSRGWWAGDIAHNAYGSHSVTQFVGMLRMELVDGTKMFLPTDGSWKSAACGAVVNGDIYDGEVYDARRGDGWKRADFDDSHWFSAVVNGDTHPTLFQQTSPDVRVRPQLERTPKKVTIYEGSVPTMTKYGRINTIKESNTLTNTRLMKGQTVVIDMGQNMVGWVDFTVEGARGTTLTLRHGEMLNYNGDSARLDKGPAGSVWTYNLRTADAKITYILAGKKGGETYHPSHTFMGFRYVELTADHDIVVKRAVGQVVGSDIEEWGDFACSDKDINQLYQNVLWGQRGNFLSIPTDCPQRDERLGWTGDTQIFSRTALYNSNASAFYRQWMRDMRNGQDSNGAFRDIAPFCKFWGEGNSAWGDAGVIVPWTVYDMTGDHSILEENYEAMQKWMQFCAAQGSDGFHYNGAGTSFGDWLAYEAIDARYISVCYYAYVTLLMQKTATALSTCPNDSYAQDAKAYKQLYDDIRAEFQSRYIDSTSGLLKTSTQTGYLLALHLGLIDKAKVEDAKLILAKKIVDNGYKLSTGFVGTGILCTTLSEVGMDEMAYQLLQQRKNPSWLYSIDQGATTIWERWDSYTIEGGFNKHEWNMNSFNHYSYGAVAEWFYAGMAGIQTSDYSITTIGKSGWKHFVLCPHIDTRPDALILAVNGERITWARAKTRTPEGIITAKWQLKGDGRITYEVSIPQDATATVMMPMASADDMVLVDGQTVKDGTTIALRKHFEVKGGQHSIECVPATTK